MKRRPCVLPMWRAYDLWAQSYPPVPHNPLMRAEQRAHAGAMGPSRRMGVACALDLASGTGRYSMLLAQKGVPRVIAVDYSAAMLRLSDIDNPRTCQHDEPAFRRCGVRHGGVRTRRGTYLAIARMDAGDWRVCLKPDGVLLYSDFHPAAAAAGMSRFVHRCAAGASTFCCICRHDVADHEPAATGRRIAP